MRAANVCDSPSETLTHQQKTAERDTGVFLVQNNTQNGDTSQMMSDIDGCTLFVWKYSFNSIMRKRPVSLGACLLGTMSILGSCVVGSHSL